MTKSKSQGCGNFARALCVDARLLFATAPNRTSAYGCLVSPVGRDTEESALTTNGFRRKGSWKSIEVSRCMKRRPPQSLSRRSFNGCPVVPCASIPVLPLGRLSRPGFLSLEAACTHIPFACIYSILAGQTSLECLSHQGQCSPATCLSHKFH
jgi:hypothetical protein